MLAEPKASAPRLPLFEGDAPPYYIASVGRALTLLSALSDNVELSVSAAADLLGIAPSSAHRLLQMFVVHGYLIQDERRMYVRGPALQELGGAVQINSAFLDAVSSPVLIALADELEGTAHLHRLEGNGVRFLTGAECAEHDNGMATLRIGWLLSGHTTAGGRSLLARLEDDELESLYPDGLPRTRYCRMRSMGELKGNLLAVRRRGFAVSRDAHERVRSVAVPLDPEGKPQFSISLGWPPERFPLKRLEWVVYRLQGAAQELSAALDP